MSLTRSLLYITLRKEIRRKRLVWSPTRKECLPKVYLRTMFRCKTNQLIMGKLHRLGEVYKGYLCHNRRLYLQWSTPKNSSIWAQKLTFWEQIRVDYIIKQREALILFTKRNLRWTVCYKKIWAWSTTTIMTIQWTLVIDLHWLKEIHQRQWSSVITIQAVINIRTY